MIHLKELEIFFMESFDLYYNEEFFAFAFYGVYTLTSGLCSIECLGPKTHRR